MIEATTDYGSGKFKVGDRVRLTTTDPVHNGPVLHGPVHVITGVMCTFITMQAVYALAGRYCVYPEDLLEAVAPPPMREYRLTKTVTVFTSDPSVLNGPHDWQEIATTVEEVVI